MKVELFPFQKTALQSLRMQAADALGSYQETHVPQVVSYTAPTGAGKTIIISSLIEDIYYGDEVYPDQPNAIFVWLSDSPELNEQSKQKIDLKADKIRLDQCVTISDDSFDQEELDDGHIYFLNTQKLGKSSNLTKHSDGRMYTIWETLQNTALDKSDRLYFIIDEAHRGMQGREAGKATTIMQKFLKGSDDDNLKPMPIVIGMTATPERFNSLVSGSTSSTIRKIVTTANDVRSSGLLKDRIVITYPDTVNNDMAVLQAAADDWKEKCEHWEQYCREQHYAQVNPVFVIQVQNGTGDKLSDTDLGDCLQKIEERTGYRFEEGEVVHTFGQTSAAVTMNGLDVRYEEPSRISDDREIRVVFFKENLSTGWDCPRAETMMSFRHANDATYIAQLLGRMVRTPLQMHIQVDDVLNDVHLYLPYFDEATVKDVVGSLQSTEGGNIPTDIYGEEYGTKTFDTWTVRPRNHVEHKPKDVPGQTSIFQTPSGNQSGIQVPNQEVGISSSASAGAETSGDSHASPAAYETQTKDHDSQQTSGLSELFPDISGYASKQLEQKSQVQPEEEAQEPSFNREEIMKAINDSGLLTYNVRSVRINNYLHSMYKLAHLLSQSGLYMNATTDVFSDIVEMIHDHIEALKSSGEYEDLAKKVMKFKLNTQVFDIFGQTIDNNQIHDMFSTTDTDIDRQFRLAEAKLGNDGVGIQYGVQYYDIDNPSGYKVDVIIFAADDECMKQLNNYAEQKFHQLNDDYRHKAVKLSEKFKRDYNNIVSDGDIVSKHNFSIPETVQVKHSSTGKEYMDHLFADDSGEAKFNLNSWEQGVLTEEEKQPDYICWLRNPPKKPWSLCIPYEMDGETKPAYPDFIVVRKDTPDDFVVDILEPHDPTRIDNLGKAKGFAEYARQNPGVGRIQLIRMAKYASGIYKFKRLDMAKSAVRDKVSKAMTNDELDHIFDTDGFFM